APVPLRENEAAAIANAVVEARRDRQSRRAGGEERDPRGTREEPRASSDAGAGPERRDRDQRDQEGSDLGQVLRVRGERQERDRGARDQGPRPGQGEEPRPRAPGDPRSPRGEGSAHEAASGRQKPPHGPPLVHEKAQAVVVLSEPAVVPSEQIVPER